MNARVSPAIWSLFGAAVVVFMLTPLVLLVLFSFGSNALTAFPMGGLTLDWYRKLLANDTFWGAAENSAIIAALRRRRSRRLIGTMAALLLARLPERVSSPLLLQLGAPVMLPALFIGVALMSFLRLALDVELGLPTVILGHLVITQPFVDPHRPCAHGRLRSRAGRKRPRSRSLAAAGLLHRHAAHRPRNHRRRRR